MPVEIKELVIKVSVNSTPEQASPGQQSTVNGSNGGVGGDEQKKKGADAVNEAVEAVLQILQDKKER